MRSTGSARLLVRAPVLLLLPLLACGGGGAAGFDPAPPQVAALALSRDSITLAVGEAAQVTVVAEDGSGNPVAGVGQFGWVVRDTAVASVRDGVVSGRREGTTRLVVSLATEQGRFDDSAVVVVSPATAGSPAHPVNTVGTSFAPPSITVAVGDSVTWLFAGAVHNVTFLGSPPPGGNIPDQTPGAEVSRTFTAPGTYAYECTRHANMSGTVIVQSGQTQVFSSVALTPATGSLVIGGTLQLTAVPQDQSGVPMAGLPPAEFASSDPTVADVTPGGLVTALASGAATITATITSGGVAHSATASVTVTAPIPGAVTVTTPNLTFSPASVTIPVGGTVTWEFSGSTHNVTFQSSAPPGGNIPDQAPGSSVSLTFPVAGTFAYRCTRHTGMNGSVLVQGGGGGGGFASLDLTPASAAVPVGGSVQLVATPRDPNGQPLTGLPPASFTSSDPAVVQVTSSGEATGLALGQVTITAELTASGVTHSATATVDVIVPAATVTTPNLTFSPEDVTIHPGETVVWQFSGATHNVTFKNTPPPGGNIPDTPAGSTVARTFPTAGDYDYECTLHPGMKGRIRVQ